MQGIYVITNIINKKVYIGQSENLKTRFNRHLYRLNRNEHHNQHLQRAFNKYGSTVFVYSILEENVASELLNERESFWIKQYGGIEDKKNYNLKDPLTNEHVEYIRKTHSKNMKGENNPNYGKKWSEEKKKKLSEKKKGWKPTDDQREKMSKAQQGRKHSEDTKDKIRKSNIGDNNPMFGKGDRQKGKNNPMFGKQSSKRKIILQIDKFTNEIIKEYNCVMQVSNDGFHIGNVTSAAKGKLKTSGGYIWRYKE